MAESDTELEALVRELGTAQKIVAPDGTARTLRGAIADIFDKTRRRLRLTGRPVHPREADDLYGHVLSMRAEVQILRAVVTELARRQGVNVDALTEQTLAALK